MSKAKEISKLIHNGNANVFEDFPFNGNKINLFGWNSEAPILEELITTHRPTMVLETGVLLGKSVIFMANIMKRLGIDGCVVANDTWLGCHHLQRIKETIPLLEFESGRPQYYRTFYNNIIHSGLSNYVVPYHTDTRSCLRGCIEMGIKFDLIHHDANHKSPDVYYDLLLVDQVLNSGGHLVIDDYNRSNNPDTDSQGFNGLCEDWDRFCKEKGYESHGLGKAWIRKN